MNEPANADRISGRDFTVGQLRAVLAIWPSLNQIRGDGIGALAAPTVSLLAEAEMSVKGTDDTLVLRCRSVRSSTRSLWLCSPLLP